MRLRRIRYPALALVSLLLLPPAARAQDLTIFVGGLMPGAVKAENITAALENGPIYGVRLSTGFAAFLKLEHSFAFSNHFLLPEGAPDTVSAKGFVFNSNLLVNVPAGICVPYATVGLGLIHQYGSDDLPIGTKFAINYGGGLKFPKLIGPIGLRIDARGYTATGVFSDTVNMFEISGGVLFSF